MLEQFGDAIAPEVDHPEDLRMAPGGVRHTAEERVRDRVDADMRDQGGPWAGDPERDVAGPGRLLGLARTVPVAESDHS